MRTTFLGYETGRRALQANQLALEVTGHNISNANAAGYSRQTLRMEATTPYAMPTMSKVYGAGMVGTGVQVTDIRAVRDFFLDAQVRNETSNIGYWGTRQDILQEVEVIFSEPQETGLRSVVDQFWSAWQDVAAHPSQEQYRQVLVQKGQELSDTFKTVFNQIRDLRTNTRRTIDSKIVEANAIFGQIADLNQQIARVLGVGDNPNDLMDTRTRLTEQLSRLMDVDVQVDKNGIMDVTVDGHMAVSGFNFDTLVPGTEAIDTTVDNSHYLPVWKNTGQPLTTQRGELGSYIDANRTLFDSYQAKVENLAQTIIDTVNQQHRQGYNLSSTAGEFSTPFDFFIQTPGTFAAASIQVDSAIVANPWRIAAADPATGTDALGNPIPVTPPPGDGANARKIADLLSEGTIIGGSRIDDFFRGMIGDLGVATQESERLAENQNLLLTQVENQRTALTGVSTDEEMINLIKYQQGYNAAARLITTIDEMVDTIINRMGLVGR